MQLEERFSRKKKKFTWKIRHVRRCAHHSSRAEARRRHVEERCPALQCIFADWLGQSRPGSDSVYGLRINPYVIDKSGTRCIVIGLTLSVWDETDGVACITEQVLLHRGGHGRLIIDEGNEWET